MNVLTAVLGEPECPNNAIYEGADGWKYKEGTSLKGKVVLPNGNKCRCGIFMSSYIG